MSENINEILKNIIETDPSCLNIIEEQIDLEIQMNYFKRVNMLRKQVVTLDEIIAKVPVLYDPDARLEEKRDILVYLASFDDVEAFRIIEKFRNQATGEIKLWASLAYRESKMQLQGALLDQNQILISSGLGGKGTSLRYFIVLVQKEKQPFTEFQTKLLQDELVTASENYNAEIESIVFENCIVKVLMLVPLVSNIKDLIDDVCNACSEFGDFIRDRAVITNVKIFSDEEIMEVMDGNLSEEDVLGLDDTHLPYFDVDDEDYDDEEDDGDESDDDE